MDGAECSLDWPKSQTVPHWCKTTIGLRASEPNRPPIRDTRSGLPSATANLDFHIFTFGVAESLETLTKRSDGTKSAVSVLSKNVERADHEPFRVLRLTASGHVAATPPIRLINSRRLMAAP